MDLSQLHNNNEILKALHKYLGGFDKNIISKILEFASHNNPVTPLESNGVRVIELVNQGRKLVGSADTRNLANSWSEQYATDIDIETILEAIERMGLEYIVGKYETQHPHKPILIFKPENRDVAEYIGNPPWGTPEKDALVGLVFGYDPKEVLKFVKNRIQTGNIRNKVQRGPVPWRVQYRHPYLYIGTESRNQADRLMQKFRKYGKIRREDPVTISIELNNRGKKKFGIKDEH